MNTAKPSSDNDLVDLELRCVTCGAPLYVALPQVQAVIDSFRRTGAVILICVCGQIQLIRRKPYLH